MKWITREHVKVDRVICSWLTQQFVDVDAEFLYVPTEWAWLRHMRLITEEEQT